MSVLNPGLKAVTVKGSTGEEASSEITVTDTAQTINRSAGATSIELYVISGNLNVRADGETATATTGRPVGSGRFIIVGEASVSVVRDGSDNAVVRVVNGAAA